MKVPYTRRVLDDLEAIHSHLTARSAAGARSVMARLQDAIAYIAESPQGSPPTDKPLVRAKWVNGYRYKIF
jgi:plasmid stabilization system protein ParE